MMKKQDIILNWLNKTFGNLTKVTRGDKIFYVDEDRKPLFYYYPDLKNGYVYIHYDRIWVFFKSIFGLKDLQTKEILKVWLEETYNLRGITPRVKSTNSCLRLEETYNLRGITPICKTWW